jgi:hypothetical protein
MTFEELDREYPNGFDDAEISEVMIDYAQRTATLQLNMRPNGPDSAERDVYSTAVLTVQGPYYLSIDPPDIDHLFGPERKVITVDGLPDDAVAFPQLGCVQSRASSGGFYCRFFVHDWNSFIHIGAAGAGEPRRILSLCRHRALSDIL